jgi:hypothetical protein
VKRSEAAGATGSDADEDSSRCARTASERHTMQIDWCRDVSKQRLSIRSTA